MDISIVILNYKSTGFVMSCIKSIKEADWNYINPLQPLPRGEFNNIREGKISYEIIVVDNDSDDAIGELLAWQYPEIKFIQNKENVGMGAGNNVGMKSATGDYIVVMNPDIVVRKNVFRLLFAYMQDNPGVGVVGPRQVNPDDSLQSSCYRWHSPLMPVYRRTPLGKLWFAKKYVDSFLMNDFDHRSIREVDWLLGSFHFLRASALEKVGLFDEKFFMYFEDTDLCRRFWKNGFKVVYNPEVEVVHNHNRESAQTKWYKFFTSQATRWHILSWFKYLRKWGM